MSSSYASSPLRRHSTLIATSLRDVVVEFGEQDLDRIGLDRDAILLEVANNDK